MKPRKVPTPEAVRLKMAALCARSEQCGFDIRRKIMRYGLPAEQADDILGFLQKQRFVDDARFARAFAADKMRFARWGRLKIRQALASKRIGNTEIAEALEGLDSEEYDRALFDAALAKARSLDLSCRDDALRLCRHLASRGFEHDKCLEALRSLRGFRYRPDNGSSMEKGGSE